MSENKIAASRGNLSTGCKVISQAISGFVHISRKPPARARVARYSGRYRPAWRISQIGRRGVGSRSKARNSRSFFSTSLIDTLYVACRPLTFVRWFEQTAVLENRIPVGHAGDIVGHGARAAGGSGRQFQSSTRLMSSGISAGSLKKASKSSRTTRRAFAGIALTL